MRTSKCGVVALLLAGLIVSAASAQTLVPVSIDSLLNWDCHYDLPRPELPYAPTVLTVGDIPFALAPYDPDGSGSPDTLGAFAVSHEWGYWNEATFAISTDVAHPITVYTLLDSTYGTYGVQIADIEFRSASGAVVSFPLIEGINVRDYHHSGPYNNIVEDDIPYVLCESPQASFVFDRQRFDLPASWANDRLTDIVIYSHGWRWGGWALLWAITVETIDTTPPTISSVSASPNVLWPANHQMVPVTVRVVAKDDGDPAPKSTITKVTCNQAPNGSGDGNTISDYQVTGDLSLLLRAERSGSDADRVYTITITCTDASGNTANKTVNVTVPHDQGNKKK